MNKKEDKQKRLMSLDTLRGFDMFFIMGGDALFLCLGTLLPGTFLEVWGGQMMHVDWHGFAFEDLIFPLFLFLAGVSFPFSLAKQRNNGSGNIAVSLRIIRRGIILILLGMIYNGLLQFDFENIRYASVLGRIGSAWMFAALLYVWVGRKWSACLSLFLLFAYWLLLRFVVAPDSVGASGYSMEGSIVGYIDRSLLPGRLHLTIHDPEGLLSTLPAIVTALLGMFTGSFVSAKSIGGIRKTVSLIAFAIILVVVGMLWNRVFPINKNLWTSSFVCYAGGLSMALFALFYFVVDVLCWRKWTLFFRVIGMNSITIYLAQQFIDFSKTTNALFGGVIELFPEAWHAVLFWVGYILICWLLLYVLYRNKIFLKV